MVKLSGYMHKGSGGSCQGPVVKGSVVRSKVQQRFILSYSTMAGIPIYGYIKTRSILAALKDNSKVANHLFFKDF